MDKSGCIVPRGLPFREAIVFLLVFLFLPLPSCAWELNTAVEVASGYDDNINRKEDKRKTESSFISVIPGFSLSKDLSDRFTADVGYDLTYTQYISDDPEIMTLQRGWSEITTLVRPRLFLNGIVRFEILDNQLNSEDDGWGLLASPRLTYHISDRLSAKLIGTYSRWKYENLDFDTGRAIIRLTEHQIDNRYEGELGVTSLLLLNSSCGLAYRFTYNDSNNSIDRYTIHHAIFTLQSALTSNLRLTLGYHYGKWNYFNWRAGRMLRGKLRDDEQHQLWAGLTYSAASYCDLNFSFERTISNSNLPYESFHRNLVFGGIRLNWNL